MKKINHNYAVILAGGQGSRFWPLSRSHSPKQFLSEFTPLKAVARIGRHKKGLKHGNLFEDTLCRLKTVVASRNIFVVTNQLYFPKIFNYTRAFKIPRANVIFEPVGKNTAASVAIASRLISLADHKAKMVVLPSDHWIENQREFYNLLRSAFSLTGLQENLVIFGIRPDYPATGYGYIKVKGEKGKVKGQRFPAKVGSRQRREKAKGHSIYQVERFIEKPGILRARRIFKDKRYFFNSGIFFGSAGTFLNEIKSHLPSLYRLILKIYTPGDIKGIWRDIKPISFDYGVLEKAKNLLMIPAINLGWSDLGTWLSLDKILPRDKLSNTITADAVVLESKNLTIFGKKRLITCIGLKDLIIVDTPDALLITRKDKSEDVKKVVDILKKSRRREV